MTDNPALARYEAALDELIHERGLPNLLDALAARCARYSNGKSGREKDAYTRAFTRLSDAAYDVRSLYTPRQEA